MRNFCLTIEYDGKNYAGWQSQGNDQRTVQSSVEKALSRILSRKTRVIASGRTDSGVHALAQQAHFRTVSSISAGKLCGALNALLPADICVTGVREAGNDFHAIASSRAKIYRYLILNRPFRSALLRGRAYFYRPSLNTARMRREAACLIGRHDFRAFCASGSSAKTTVRTIRRLSVKRIPYNPLGLAGGRGERSVICVEIEADGFLYNMVRAIVGTLIESGRGRLGPGAIKKILLSKDRSRAGPAAAPEGLYLAQVEY